MSVAIVRGNASACRAIRNGWTTCLEQNGAVIYRSKDGHTTRSFSAIDWPAMIISHIPRHGEQMVCVVNG